MPRFMALIVFGAAALFLAREYRRPPAAPPLPPPPPATAGREPGPVFSEREIAKVRQSIADPDAGVRWAAVQLLYNVRDPQLGPLIERMIAEDPDPELRIKVVGLMKGREELVRLGGLVRGLQDVDKNVRIAALEALGDIGDPSVTTWVTALLKDHEPEVRIKALHTLGRFQDRRKEEFRALAEKLKTDYEAALVRAAKRK